MNCTNKFLVSLPIIRDHSFKNSVVFVHQHNADGAAGFIFNKPLDKHTSASLRKSIGIKIDVPVYYGGPVDLNNAAVIHSSDIVTPYSLKISKDLYMSRDKKFINLINDGFITDKFKLIIGYSGWGPSQLESEILGSRTAGLNGWTITNYDKKLFWDSDIDFVWNKGIHISAKSLTDNLLKTAQC